MKPKIFKLKTSLLTLVMILISVSLEANQINSNNINNLLSPGSEQNSDSKQDSLPEGVTQDWLKSLRDENGKSIISEETETDAPAPTILNGITGGSYFGVSVSDAGDVNGDGYSDIIVGASNYSSATGRAYIFFGGVNMNTTPDVTLTGEATNNQFGFPVSGGGDVNGDGYSDVIVGASDYSSSKGRAYIYYGGILMNNVADVIFTGEAAGNYFGISVSNDGDVNGDGYSDVLIGANGYSTNTGRAYFYFGGSAMNNVADLIMTGETVNNQLGYSVSTAGDVNGDSFSDLIIGAYGAGQSLTGKAYIYFGGVSMNNIADVAMTGESANNGFGVNVSNAGDVNDDGYSDVIIGANGYSSSTGRAYIFYGGSSMNNAADITMTGEASSNYFGRYVSEAGDINGDGYSDVIVGAWGYSSAAGRAYIYLGGFAMNNVADLTVTGEGTNNFFGYPVSACGDLNGDGYSEVIVGGYGYNSNTGRVYLYDYSATGAAAYDIIMTGEMTTKAFGVSVSSAGDINGDSFSDVIVGASSDLSSRGKAYIFYGGSPMNNVADVTISDYEDNSLFGKSVSSAGDVNGDGYSDVIVGAEGHSSYTGRACIFYGGSPMNNVWDVEMTGVLWSEFGESVSSAGDVNGDGYSDVIVGTSAYFNGIAYIFYGGSTMNNVADVTMTGEGSLSLFGESVSSAGDVNNDGYSDVIVGASAYSSYTGRAYIYYGGAPMNNVSDLVLTGTQTGIRFGNSISSAGDVNGDGYSDVIVGAFQYSSNTGRAYVFYGGLFMNNTADVTMTGEESFNYFGRSVSSAGDINNDGFSDIIVGADESSSKGRAYIYFGGAVMNNAADLTMTGEGADNHFGISVSDAGDVNGDGYPDVIAGAPEYSSTTGRAYILLSPIISHYINLNLAIFIQGFYDSGSNSQVSDTITVYLRNNNSPYNSIDSTKSIVSANGISSLKFSNAPTGTYYLVVKHRNSIETWSATGILLRRVLTPEEYDFSTSSSKAYGNNQIQIDTSPNRFAIYNGDVNQDGSVDLTDIVSVFNDASVFISGYIPTDVNGDNTVDLSDIILTFNNSSNFVSVVKP